MLTSMRNLQQPDGSKLYNSYCGFTSFSLLGESSMNSLWVQLGITDLAAGLLTLKLFFILLAL
ncbi:hypothetical protein I3760_01G282300 [Carya illinoinensis]|nr:hypothetical protein I3760_01G282300 [Carya illinoinensis]